MKTLMKHAMIYLGLCISSSAYSQATYAFFNYESSVNLDAPVFDAQRNRLFGNNYVALLYGGPTMEDLQVAKEGDLITSMNPVPFLRIVNGQAGYFARSPEVTITTVPAGEFAWLQVRAWDNRLGSTYDEVARLGIGGFGASSLFQARGGDTMGVILPQPLLGLESFNLVPEPGTWALLALGSGILFWKCRHRCR
jgi:hypothetical protein